MKFQAGDVIRHERGRKRHWYFIVDRDEENYYYIVYEGTLFSQYNRDGSYPHEYLEKLVETTSEEKEEALQGLSISPSSKRSNNTPSSFMNKTDRWAYVSHINDSDEPRFELGGNQPAYTIHFEKMVEVMESGFDVIRDAWIFHEAVQPPSKYTVRKVGHSSDDLADDMILLRRVGDNRNFPETAVNVVEAVERGIWIPLRPVESKIDERKVSQI